MSTLQTDLQNRRANVVGVGMIGASIAVAMRKIGWFVSGWDENEDRCEKALRLGFVDQIGIDKTADLSVVATPVSAVVDVVADLLETKGWVTDVASVKAGICNRISHPNFVGGHPMAGSEKSGPENAIPDLFQGATWVLTPTVDTNPAALADVKNLALSLGATTVTTTPEEHDFAVANVSHVPHLVSSALMAMANRQSSGSSPLRLSAGGFRDMTRIAAGSPDLWTGIALENRSAIVETLTDLADQLQTLKSYIEEENSSGLQQFLNSAAVARQSLPERAGRPKHLSVVRIVVPDRPGALGEILGVFGSLGINVEDFEITHDESNTRGYLEVTVDASQTENATSRLTSNGFVVGSEEL